jgi:UDP-GlcNAc:undecaprenyl-phosphate GlcNAc-1-phosphate transferase
LEAARALPYIVAAIVAAGIVSFALTPLTIRLARRLGAIDEPDMDRRVHKEPVPRTGGIAVAISFLVVGLLAVWWTVSTGTIKLGNVDRDVSGALTDPLIGLFGGVILAALFGFVDDRWQIRARWQFLSQLALAGVAIAAGITITFFFNPFAGAGQSSYPLLAGWQVGIVTAVWVIGMINSLNFIDGLDGLSSGISVIAALTLGVISLTQEQPTVALLCGVLAGALAGFLPWNFHPARVFTGTTGVMTVGYALATLSILGTAKYAVALLVLGVPIIDTFWIIIRRLSHGQSPFRPDRGHLHHRLLDLGLTHRDAVLLIYAICAGLAVLSMVLSTAQTMYTFVGFVVGGGLLLFILTRRTRPDALEAVSYPEGPPDVGPQRSGSEPTAGPSQT